jgi:hypothetical protein
MSFLERFGFRRAALLLWVIALVVITALVVTRPEKRTLIPLYREASLNWLCGEALYQGPGGMNYLPCFAVLFTPVAVLPTPVADLVWRYLIAFLLIGGLWRLSRSVSEEGAERRFLMATALAMPLCLGVLRNGQANGMIAALTIQAVAALAWRQWTLATVCMVLALAVKPLGMVFIGLAVVMYPPVRWRTAIGVVALAVFPFLFTSPAYVIEQHRAFLDNIRSCAQVGEHRFADINGIVRTFGGELPARVATVLRAVAGLLTLALCWFGWRRLSGALQALWLYALATVYLMLFNPMNETNSYVIVVPALALWAERVLSQTATRTDGWVLAGIVIAISVFSPLRSDFKLFWYPTMTIVFAGLLTTLVFRRKLEAT